VWLALCDPADRAAVWAYRGLRARGLTPLELLAPQTLLGSTRSAHRIGRDGADFEITLPDGRVLASREVDGVLNRVACAPFGYLPFTTHADAMYAAQELAALLLSCSPAWPRSRSTARPGTGCAEPGVRPRSGPRSRPGPGCRCGRPESPTAPTTDRPGRRPSAATCYSSAPPEAADERAYVRLARLAGADPLGIDLRRDDRQQEDGRPAVFAEASPLPDLRLGGDPFLDHLLKHLTGLSPGAP
jgi:hypothetical protein